MNSTPSKETLQRMINAAEISGYTHSAAVLKKIYARYFTQPARQALKESCNPFPAYQGKYSDKNVSNTLETNAAQAGKVNT